MCCLYRGTCSAVIGPPWQLTHGLMPMDRSRVLASARSSHSKYPWSVVPLVQERHSENSGRLLSKPSTATLLSGTSLRSAETLMWQMARRASVSP